MIGRAVGQTGSFMLTLQISLADSKILLKQHRPIVFSWATPESQNQYCDRSIRSKNPFIGGRSQPQKYTMFSLSYLFWPPESK